MCQSLRENPPGGGRLNIIPLGREHRSEIARLHLDHLRGRFKGVAGQNLLERYYGTVSIGRGATGFVALKGLGVVGYVCGVWDPASVRRELVRQYWASLLVWGIFQIVTNPPMLRRFLPARLLGQKDSDETLKGYELRPIVVTPSSRGTGAAMLLVHALVADAADRGFDSIYLLTEPDNFAAKKFYIKAGFSVTGQAARSGVDFLVYSREVVRA